MLRKKLAVLVAAAMMLVSVFAVAGPAVAVSDNFNGNSGNHFGDARNPDSGNHTGGGIGGGRFK
jgi:hypothetical protein